MTIPLSFVADGLKLLARFTGFEKLKKRIQSKRDRRNRAFSGNWNNQMFIIIKPTHYIDFDGWGHGKHFEGRFNVRNVHDIESWELFDLIGKRRGNKLKCKLFKNSGGVKIYVATGTFTKVKNGMFWKLEEAYSNQFPAIATLDRGFPKFV